MGDTDLTTIYFSDFFGLDPSVVEEHGALNVSLINDLPLFIDPFLLFNSDKSEYQALHAEIVKYVSFLRDKALAGEITDGLLEEWFTFREVRENWLGYSLEGNGGSGLGTDFAQALSTSLRNAFSNFGKEKVSHGAHLEKVCLVSDGVGRDNISDFSTNLIKHYLLSYTQTFALEHLRPEQRRSVAVRKAQFNYETESWVTRTYELPFVNGGHVLLTPIDMLTKEDVWINRSDLVDLYPEIATAIPNTQLRAKVNNYFSIRLNAIQARDEERKRRQEEKEGKKKRRKTKHRERREPTKSQMDEAATATIHEYPEFIDYYVRWKEEHGEEAEAQADAKVRSSKQLYIAQVQQFALKLLTETGFYNLQGHTREEARQRVLFLKDVIENKGGWRFFYSDGEPIRRESDIHILFRLTWCNTPSDVNREVNSGRGPSDYEVSRGRFDKTLVEFKLAKNTALEKNLRNQAEIYQKASDAQHAMKVIVYFTREERERVTGILKVLKIDKNRDVILIDARDDNKPSASKADGSEND